MTEQAWRHDGRNVIVCVDSYHDGVLRGRLYHSHPEPEVFESLTQFLVKMEKFLDTPQPPPDLNEGTYPDHPTVLPLRRGARATFQVQVLFRHNTSWQGVMVWLEEHKQQRFRSVLSLILLLDSALIPAKEGDAV